MVLKNSAAMEYDNARGGGGKREGKKKKEKEKHRKHRVLNVEDLKR
jgi:hypothetical protein